MSAHFVSGLFRDGYSKRLCTGISMGSCGMHRILLAHPHSITLRQRFPINWRNCKISCTTKKTGCVKASGLFRIVRALFQKLCDPLKHQFLPFRRQGAFGVAPAAFVLLAQRTGKLGHQIDLLVGQTVNQKRPRLSRHRQDNRLKPRSNPPCRRRSANWDRCARSRIWRWMLRPAFGLHR